MILSVDSLAGDAFALDKQGSAHGGQVHGAEEGMDLSGAAILGVALYNPSYAARPDNSGLALMRYAAHFDWDLVGRRLSVPIDVNLFSDRKRAGLLKFGPTEFDWISGITSTWDAGPGALEIGSRVENDRPVDRGGTTQTYLDLRARYLYSLAGSWPALGRALDNGDLSGFATLGWFAYNPSYLARPDNTGRALFRYAVHGELSVLDDAVSVGADATFFTDRKARYPYSPSELDFTPELILRHSDFELHFAYERDMPVDRGSYVQQFAYALLVWSFSVVQAPGPLEGRTPIQSP